MIFAILIAALDFVAGNVIGPSVLLLPTAFIFPVMLLAWNYGWRSAVMLAVMLSLARLGFHFVWTHPWAMHTVLLNTAVRAALLSLAALFTAGLAFQTRALRERVRTLEGILPICMHCNKIRDDAEEWQQLEAYISAHSQADFSHGICPGCAEEHYGASFATAAPHAGLHRARMPAGGPPA